MYFKQKYFKHIKKKIEKNIYNITIRTKNHKIDKSREYFLPNFSLMILFKFHKFSYNHNKIT